MENLEIMNSLFANIYSGQKVLITGHTGFKGTWLALWLKKMGANVAGYSLAEENVGAHYSALNIDLQTQEGDIRDKEKLHNFINEVNPSIIFHLAARSLVRESYKNPSLTYETNVIGTFNVLEGALRNKHVKAIINVTTDKVYENFERDEPYNEQDRLGGYDMYSSSKACSEILSASFRKSFLTENTCLLATARAGNVIGGGDWATDRLIPDIMRNVMNGNYTEIRSPHAIRPWEHVLEPLSGYLLLGQKLLEGKQEFATSWNFGPEPENAVKVEEVINKMQREWPRIKIKINEDKAELFHEAGILKLDCSKALSLLQWQPVWGLEKTIRITADWYKNYYENKVLSTTEHLMEYINDAKNTGVKWAS